MLKYVASFIRRFLDIQPTLLMPQEKCVDSKTKGKRDFGVFADAGGVFNTQELSSSLHSKDGELVCGCHADDAGAGNNDLHDVPAMKR